MILAGLALLLLSGLAATWLLMFPAGQSLGARILAQARAGLAGTAGAAARRTAGSLDSGLGAGRKGAGRLWTHLRRHRQPYLAALALVMLPPLFIAHFRQDVQPSTTTVGGGAARDRHIVRLLQGERLVPPAPLPPAMFTAREVERIRPQLATANRKWEQLDPEFSQKLLLVFELMRERHGYELALLEGYRSPERQQRLAAMGAHVTNAGMYQSYHQYGLAADVAFVREGRLVISERDPWAMRGYELYGEIAASLGLTWGGNWRMRDYGHVELRRPGARRPPADANL